MFKNSLKIIEYHLNRTLYHNCWCHSFLPRSEETCKWAVGLHARLVYQMDKGVHSKKKKGSPLLSPGHIPGPYIKVIMLKKRECNKVPTV